MSSQQYYIQSQAAVNILLSWYVLLRERDFDEVVRSFTSFPVMALALVNVTHTCYVAI